MMSSSDRIIRTRRRGGDGTRQLYGPSEPVEVGGSDAAHTSGSVLRGLRSGPALRPAGTPQGRSPSVQLSQGSGPARSTSSPDDLLGADEANAGMPFGASPDVASPLLHAAIRDVYQRAEQRGHAAGRQRAEAELRTAMETARAMAEMIEAMAPREATAVARDIARLALAIARRIVGDELQLDPTILVSILEAAASSINGSPEARVLLHPDALGPVSAAWGAVHGTAYLGKRWTFEPDATLPLGACTLRYDHGVVAAGLESQLDEIKAAIDDAIPGLHRDHPREPAARST